MSEEPVFEVKTDTKDSLEQAIKSEVRYPPWVAVTPFFMSSLLFITVFFAVFSPLPIVILKSLQKNFLTAVALLTNLAIIWFLGGVSSAVLFACLAIPVAVGMPWMMFQKKYSFEVSTLLAWFVSCLLAAGFVLATIHLAHIDFIPQLKKEMDPFVDQLITASRDQGEPISLDRSEVINQMLDELPSVLAILFLITAWSNAVLLIRMNIGQIRQRLGLDNRFLYRWKSPEWLVYPAIIAGAVLIFSHSDAALVARSVLKALLAVYAIQGISILGYVLEHFAIKGLLRMVLFVMIIMFALPILIGVGFFDLWFDFRSKLRQS